MKRIILSVIFAVFATVMSFAQTTYYEWEQYGVGFTIDNSLQIEQNDAETFLCVNSEKDWAVSLNPMEYGKLKPKQVGKQLAELAFGEMNFDATEGNYAIKEFSCINGEGVFILGFDTEKQKLGIVAIAFSEATKMAVLVLQYMPEEKAEAAGAVLGSITFK